MPNLNFINQELATIVGTVNSGDIYGYWKNYENVKILRDITVVCQDGPLGFNLLVEVMVNNVSVFTANVPCDVQPAGEELVRLFAISPGITLSVGDYIQIKATSLGGYPGGNVKIFGDLEIID